RYKPGQAPVGYTPPSPGGTRWKNGETPPGFVPPDVRRQGSMPGGRPAGWLARDRGDGRPVWRDGGTEGPRVRPDSPRERPDVPRWRPDGTRRGVSRCTSNRPHRTRSGRPHRENGPRGSEVAGGAEARRVERAGPVKTPARSVSARSGCGPRARGPMPYTAASLSGAR